MEITKNQYEIRQEYAVIFLNRRDSSILECFIDKGDLEIAQTFEGKWYAHRNRHTKKFYVYGNQKRNDGKYSTLKLHTLILETPKHLCVDHINGNTLDNRRCNIRNVTQGENNQNKQGSYKNNNSSGIRGITWHKLHKKWYATVMVNGKQKFIGLFTDLSEAEKSVKEARAKYLPYSKEALAN